MKLTRIIISAAPVSCSAPVSPLRGSAPASALSVAQSEGEEEKPKRKRRKKAKDLWAVLLIAFGVLNEISVCKVYLHGHICRQFVFSFVVEHLQWVTHTGFKSIFLYTIIIKKRPSDTPSLKSTRTSHLFRVRISCIYLENLNRLMNFPS